MEEYGLNILYHPDEGKCHFITFSCLPHCDELSISLGENASAVLFNVIYKSHDISNDSDLLECFLNLPLSNVAENKPVDLKLIYTQKTWVQSLLQKLLSTLTNTSTSLLMVI